MENKEGTGEPRAVRISETKCKIVTMITSNDETETIAGARPTNDQCNAAQLSKVIQVDHCGAGGRSKMQCRCSVLVRAA